MTCWGLSKLNNATFSFRYYRMKDMESPEELEQRRQKARER